MDRILNVYKSTEPLKINLPVPSIKQRIHKDMIFDKEPYFPSTSQCSKESETEYVKKYVHKEEQEYIQVINIKIYIIIYQSTFHSSLLFLPFLADEKQHVFQ